MPLGIDVNSGYEAICILLFVYDIVLLANNEHGLHIFRYG